MNAYISESAVARRMGLRVSEARDQLAASHGLRPDNRGRYQREAIDAALSPKARVPKPGSALPAVAPPKRKAIDFQPDGALRGLVSLKQITKRMGLASRQADTARARLRKAGLEAAEAEPGKPKLWRAEAVESLIAEAPWENPDRRYGPLPKNAPGRRDSGASSPLAPTRGPEVGTKSAFAAALQTIEQARSALAEELEASEREVFRLKGEIRKHDEALEALRGLA